MKKLLALVMAMLMIALCVSAGAETINLKVWGSQESQPWIQEMCEGFAKENADKTFSFEYGVVGEADARPRYSEDPAAAADVFAFPDDQLIDLVKADALMEVTRNLDAIVAANLPGTVSAASVNGTLYGYPMTADNGYFMYYDKSVLTEEDVKTLDGMLAAANKAGKKVFMDVSNGWYIASFFMGAGCKLELDTDGKQVCDFNNEKGLAAAEAIRAFCNDPAFITGDDSLLQGGMGDSICAGVSGTWSSTAIKEKLGDNYAACKLPTFTCAGEQVQMASFLGCKVLGVNTQSANPLEAMMLAEYMTSEAAQLRRFELMGHGPSNVNAAASDAVKTDPALAALAAQSPYAVSQRVLGTYWTPAEAFGAEMENHSTAELQPMLDQLVAQATAE